MPPFDYEITPGMCPRCREGVAENQCQSCFTTWSFAVENLGELHSQATDISSAIDEAFRAAYHPTVILIDYELSLILQRKAQLGLSAFDPLVMTFRGLPVGVTRIRGTHHALIEASLVNPVVDVRLHSRWRHLADATKYGTVTSVIHHYESGLTGGSVSLSTPRGEITETLSRFGALFTPDEPSERALLRVGSLWIIGDDARFTITSLDQGQVQIKAIDQQDFEVRLDPRSFLSVARPVRERPVRPPPNAPLEIRRRFEQVMKFGCDAPIVGRWVDRVTRDPCTVMRVEGDDVHVEGFFGGKFEERVLYLITFREKFEPLISNTYVTEGFYRGPGVRLASITFDPGTHRVRVLNVDTGTASTISYERFNFTFERVDVDVYEFLSNDFFSLA